MKKVGKHLSFIPLWTEFISDHINLAKYIFSCTSYLHTLLCRRKSRNNYTQQLYQTNANFYAVYLNHGVISFFFFSSWHIDREKPHRGPSFAWLAGRGGGSNLDRGVDDVHVHNWHQKVNQSARKQLPSGCLRTTSVSVRDGGGYSNRRHNLCDPWILLITTGFMTPKSDENAFRGMGRGGWGGCSNTRSDPKFKGQH